MGGVIESCFPLYDSHLRRLLVSRPHLRHTDERIGIFVCLAHGHGSSHLQRQRRICSSESTSLFLSSAAGFRHGVYDRSPPSVLRHHHARRFKHKGWKKPLLIYFMSDETFSVNYTAKIPKDVDEGWFMLWITLLDFLYWLTGATLGGIFGNLITFSTKGLDFVMTAMFVVIFVEQWLKDSSHVSAILGIVLSVISLLLFGPGHFVIPAMMLMLLALLALRPRLAKVADKESDVMSDHRDSKTHLSERKEDQA